MLAAAETHSVTLSTGRVVKMPAGGFTPADDSDALLEVMAVRRQKLPPPGEILESATAVSGSSRLHGTVGPTDTDGRAMRSRTSP